MKPLLIAKTCADRHHKLLRDHGIAYDQVDPLEFQYVYDIRNVRQDLEDASAIALTSSTSVRVLTKLPEEQRGKKVVYVVGDHTANAVRSLGYRTIICAQDSEGLAKHAPWDKSKPVLYLCGNLRRNILTQYWTKHGISFRELLVYKTQYLNPVIDSTAYSSILFFSPSGVTSLLSVNDVDKTMRVGSIGPTTTQRLKYYGLKNIIQAPAPTFTSLVETLVAQA